MNAPLVAQIRPTSVVHYFDVSYCDFERKPNKKALNQNNRTVYRQLLKKMESFDDIPSNYFDINEFSAKIDDLHEEHRKASESLNIQVKPYATFSLLQMKNFKKCLETMISYTLFNSKKVDFSKINSKENPYLSFCTLTLPVKQMHTDKALRKCLVRFIENLTKSHGVEHYVWKAEPQQNGNIHFHIVFDRFIDKTTIRKLWNSQIQKLGYINKYQSIKNTNTQPPSTEIKSLRKIHDIQSYIGKYLTKKEEGKRKIIGKLWGASNQTKKLQYPQIFGTDSFYHYVKKLIDLESVKLFIREDFFSFHVGKIHDTIRKEFRVLWNEVSRHYKHFKNFVESKKDNIVLEIQKIQSSFVQYDLFDHRILYCPIRKKNQLIATTSNKLGFT
jgi:hypothetical protein